MTYIKNGRLLVISDMSHHLVKGQVVGHGATVRELSCLAMLFDEVRHIGCLYKGENAPSELPYSVTNISLIPVPPSGGPKLWHKLKILLRLPTYLRTIMKELPHADVVHVRSPANIPLIALILLAMYQKPRIRWIKYAGNWRSQSLRPIFFTFQRWWLRTGATRAQVTINSMEPTLPGFFHTFNNPCLTDDEYLHGLKVAQNKHLTLPIHFLFVGNMNSSKGVQRTLHVLSELKNGGLNCHLDLVGDGPQRREFEKLAHALQLTRSVTFHGALPRPTLSSFYQKAHFLLLLSDSEGWPKVVSEALAYGCVPLTGDISGIKEKLLQIGAGRSFNLKDRAALIAAIYLYLEHPEKWKQEAVTGAREMYRFTYTYYLQAVVAMLKLKYTFNLPAAVE